MIVPILMYHSIEKESDDYLTVKSSDFEQQIRHLSSSYNIIQVQDILNAIEIKEAVPPNSIAITFDDAYENNFTYALPILQRHSVKAVFFVIANYIGNYNLWNCKAPKLIRHMTVENIKLLKTLGHEIGNHTLTHQRLTKLTDDLLSNELIESNKILTAILGFKPYTFAYPYGGADDRCAKICNDIFPACFSTTRIGDYDLENSTTFTRRIYISPDDGAKELDFKIMNYYKGMYNDV